MQDYHKLTVWSRAMDLAEDRYAATRRFPTTERFGIASQMNRAAVSIAANIAEGCGRGTNRDFARFLRIAYASACELETEALLAKRVGLADAVPLDQLILDVNEVRRMLNGLVKQVTATAA
jgi:four helix bundle protein